MSKRPYFWIGHRRIGMIGVGVSFMRQRGWGIEIGLWPKRDPEPGEIIWRWWWSRTMPRIQFIYRASEFMWEPGAARSELWTGMKHQIVGVEIGRRCWIWD